MTIKELQQARQDQGTTQAAEQNPDISILSGSFSTTSRKRSAKKSVHTHDKKVCTPRQEKVYTPEEDQPDNIQHITQQDQQAPYMDQDIETDNTPDMLPAGLYDDIHDYIAIYSKSLNIDDTMKIHPLQWQAVCIYIGQQIKTRGVLRDRDRERTEGGRIYNGEKLVALLALYGVICAEYKQVAFDFNFYRFAGVSREFFYDYKGRGLTSSRVDIAKKAADLQKASLVGAVTGGGSATVGNIFLSKALAGLQETVTVQHVSAAAVPVSNALPVFGGDSPALPVSENP